MTFEEVLDQAMAMLQRRGRVTYRTLQIRVGLNAGEVVVRAIGNDLHMDYSAIGQTTHLAARMEQMAMPGTILLTPAVVDL
ncbi:MAG TPA: adenylate/guanylate cyclase domain-containing protein, partial [Candidatus Saccharimonadia bacterium]|nr:adenylate/guanylate cyclase domain-containing protein [Candidatus Saccharimonadia bacterium]